MQYGLWGLILGCIISSIIIGIFTGLVNWAARIPSLVVTLGLTMIFEIIALQISGKTSLVSLSRELSILGRPPYIIITLAISFILFYLAFYHTRFSYHARAIGSDEMIAQNMGIKIQWIKFLTFVVGGAFLGIASILQISVSGSISAQVDLGSAMLLFKPLMGVMVAIALQSICNLAVGIIIGEFSINMIFVGLIASGLPDTFQNVTLGLFLLIVMFLSVNKGGITKCFKRKPNVSIPGNAA
jgi:ribose transport system permease protein